MAPASNESDGTGGTQTFDPSTLSGAPAHVAVDRIVGSAALMGVKLKWDATTTLLFYSLGANTYHNHAWRYSLKPGASPGLLNGAGADKTGKSYSSP